jgi:hypothetical protein
MRSACPANTAFRVFLPGRASVPALTSHWQHFRPEADTTGKRSLPERIRMCLASLRSDRQARRHDHKREECMHSRYRRSGSMELLTAPRVLLESDPKVDRGRNGGWAIVVRGRQYLIWLWRSAAPMSAPEILDASIRADGRSRPLTPPAQEHIAAFGGAAGPAARGVAAGHESRGHRPAAGLVQRRVRNW